MLIYHIVTPEVWEKYKDEYEYEAESLQTEGFIHCSYRNQLEDVLERYYKNVRSVFVLHINPHLLTSQLIAESSTNREIYPHVYGKINRPAVVDVEKRTLR
ncbi:MAG: DUF952 domain-containing protein [Pyrinomonadaceae bacterium]|nr:DUF952 domain-containing protein [Pyrinomonadaceae bacterium]